MSNLAIIPARGGSKRIPRKNIREMLGRPIMAYPIKAALDSGVFDEVMVSTEDLEIAEIAKKYGAKVPFLRSTKNSDDVAGTREVLEEVCLAYKDSSQTFDFVCCVYPTAALISPTDISDSYDIFRKSDSKSLVSTCEYDFHPLRSFKEEAGTVNYQWPEFKGWRSQDLPRFVHDAGMFYWASFDHLLNGGDIVTEYADSFEIDRMRVQDIDTLEDWSLAEIKLSNILL